MKKTTVIKCDYREIENLLKEHYGITHYEIVAAEEVSNGSNLDITVDGKLDDYDLKGVAEVLSGKFKHYFTGQMMNKLCADGYLEAGEYIVEIYW